jgi:hypothetical protein
MIKNNVRALLYHILIIILSTLYLILLVSLGPYIGGLIRTPIVRGLMCIIFAGTYIYAGSRLNIRHRIKYDFQAGLLIALIGLILWGISVFQTGLDLRPVNEELAYLYIPLNIFLNPMLQIGFLLDIEFNQLVRLIACFIPGLLMGIGIKFKRYKYSRRVQKSV